MEDFLNNVDTKTKICCCSITSVVLVISICAILSFGAVEPTQYGILYNSITKELYEEKVYGGGLQYTGLFHSLITFPAVHQTIEFSNSHDASAVELKTRTKEGLELRLHFAF